MLLYTVLPELKKYIYRYTKKLSITVQDSSAKQGCIFQRDIAWIGVYCL